MGFRFALVWILIGFIWYGWRIFRLSVVAPEHRPDRASLLLYGAAMVIAFWPILLVSHMLMYATGRDPDVEKE